jgi:hypothetical protein
MRIAGDRHRESSRPRAGGLAPRTLAAVALAAVLIAACSTAAQAAAPSARCSWAGETDQRDVNIGAPDLDAYYWVDTLHPQSGTKVAITGSYPRARYFSFHVYDAGGNALTSTYDRQINADPGSANPYRAAPRRGTGDSYTVTIEFGPRPSHPAANTLYVDPSSAGSAAMLVYRVYVPQDPNQPSGNVPFPKVTTETASGQPVLSEGACSTTPPAFGSAIWSQDAAADYPAFGPTPSIQGATLIPTWERSFGSMLGNQQNAYLVTTVSRQYGDLVVIHAHVPTFPNTRAGQPAYKRYQVRYWSFCTYDQDGQAGVGCAADYGATIRSGSVTYVVSDAGARPPNATAARGVTWLPWGGAQSAAQIVYRNMLPAPGFVHAAQRITPTSNVHAVMGAYYPQAVYCAPPRFARGGWRACFAAAGVPTAGPSAPRKRPSRRPCKRARRRRGRSAQVRCRR